MSSPLASLTRAYDRMAERREVPPFGYSIEKIHACIVLDRDGRMVGPPVSWNRDDRGKAWSNQIAVPYFGGRSGSDAPPYFLWDNTAYVLGVTSKEKYDALKRFYAFKEFHLEQFSENADEGLCALATFLSKWHPEQYYSVGFSDDLKDRNIVFRFDSDQCFIHERVEAKSLWEKIYKPDVIGQQICLISGETVDIARLHPPIRGFENPARIVSFDKNSDAFSSYGKVQGANAPTGIKSAFAYTAALNRFLSPGSRNRIQIGDATTVFWADASSLEAASMAEELCGIWFGINEGAEAQKVGAILEKIRNAQRVEDFVPDLPQSVRFHVLGLAPNAARLSIRFWYEGDFGQLAENYWKFVQDMRIEPPWHRNPNPPLWQYLTETALLHKRDNVPPNLAGEWMRAILTGTRYPMTLLATVLMRIRADGEINALRAGMLKAILNRNSRQFKGKAPVALDDQCKEKGYVLGRLFAVYEQVQTAALGRNVNATIKDKFYGSASAQPRKVFALLDRGSAAHLSKVGKQSPGYRVNLEKQIADIMGAMSPADAPFPASLSSEQQALFALGYYHQRSEFFKSKKIEKNEEIAA